MEPWGIALLVCGWVLALMVWRRWRARRLTAAVDVRAAEIPFYLEAPIVTDDEPSWDDELAFVDEADVSDDPPVFARETGVSGTVAALLEETRTWRAR
jgi:hypothetical protein